VGVTLSEAEHRWNYTCQQLELAREEVDTHTHMIVHLEHAIEMQDLKLEEWAAMITTTLGATQTHNLR
jgi:hypothetical protein